MFTHHVVLNHIFLKYALMAFVFKAATVVYFLISSLMPDSDDIRQ